MRVPHDTGHRMELTGHQQVARLGAMSRIFITGSADGLGLMAARLLIQDGHEVVLHARSEQRGHEALEERLAHAAVLVGDLSSIDQMRRLASDANAYGRFDAVIHNAGVGYREPRTDTVDGLEHVFAINVLAPYLLTALWIVRTGWCISVRGCTRAAIRTLLICSGSGAVGMVRRRTRIRS